MCSEDFNYSRFAPMFKALDFNAETWAELFKKSRAKYIVLTTKHHDGFVLWPSKEASRNYGYPRNNMELGSKRNLVGEYAKALRKTDLKVGCYYFLQEWGNPLYTTETMDVFTKRHFLLRIKDLVVRYEPDIIWADGPDNISDSLWRTCELLSWLYSESPVKNKVVLNDRWAKKPDENSAISTPRNIVLRIKHSTSPGRNAGKWDFHSLIIKTKSWKMMQLPKH